MPRAEIVQRPLHAKLAQLLDVVLQLRIVRQRLALGDFRTSCGPSLPMAPSKRRTSSTNPWLAKCEPLTLTPR